MLKKSIIILITIIFIACEGPIGPTGMRTLLELSNEPIGIHCDSGGLRINSGPDTNENGTLDNEEIEVTTFVCNGQNGKNALTMATVEPKGSHCLDGGIRIDTGTDLDNDALLDANEVNATTFVCNGLNGNNSLIKTTPEPLGTNCSNGGFKIDAGTDTNNNGILDNSEITSTNFICNGNNGRLDSQVRLLLTAYGANGNGTSGTTGDLFGTVIKFNKTDYAGVTSIVFSPKVFTSNASNQTYVELYNVTDDVVIANSTLSPSASASTFETAEILQSTNIFDSLPEKEISLSIRLRSSGGETAIFLTGESYLIMLRN